MRLTTLAMLGLSCAPAGATPPALPPPPVASVPRDVVIVIDASQADVVAGVEGALYDLVAAMGTPADHIGVVRFAGAAEVSAPLQPVGSAQARAAVAGAAMCDMGADAWYHTYRFRNWSTRPGDPELGGLGWTYRFVSPGAGSGGGAGLGIPFDISRFESLWFRIFNPIAHSWNEQDWLADRSPQEQCVAWDASRMLYEIFDERVTRSASYGGVGLPCHVGNWYEGRPEATFDDDPGAALEPVDCGLDIPGITPPLPAYGGAASGLQFPDLSYGLAGNHTYAGLQATETMLAASRSGRDPVVVLVGADPDPCPRLARPADRARCLRTRVPAIEIVADRIKQTLGATITVLRVANPRPHTPTDVLRRVASARQYVDLQTHDGLRCQVARQLALLVPPHTGHSGDTGQSTAP